MSSHTLVEAAVGKDAERGCEMLLAVQSLFLQRVELWVGADPQPLATRRLAQCADGAVLS